MNIFSVKINNFRNLRFVELSLNARFNLLLGKNGSGKSNFLEAIYVLSVGRSLRAKEAAQTILFGEESYTLFGLIHSTLQESAVKVGVERNKKGKAKIRIAEQDAVSLSELARILPIQLINSRSYELLEAEPQHRRQFLDWILFHVEPSFYTLWQRYRRALRQRNAALKAFSPQNNLNVQIWDKELAETGEAIHILRDQFMTEWLPFFKKRLDSVLGISGVSIIYKKGWSEDRSLEQALKVHFERDCACGYTSQGVHRADLEFYLETVPVKNVLSRGQTKLFVCSLLLSRAQFFYEKTERRSVFLVDDLTSELDSHSSYKLVEALETLGGQVVITGIEPSSFARLMVGKDSTMFHVEQGEIIKSA